jgi:dextranase
MKQILSIYIFLIFTLFLSACEKDDDGNNTPPDNNGSGSNGTVVLTTDKARYNPGEEVTISSDKMLSGDVKVRYRQRIYG